MSSPRHCISRHSRPNIVTRTFYLPKNGNPAPTYQPITPYCVPSIPFPPAHAFVSTPYFRAFSAFCFRPQPTCVPPTAKWTQLTKPSAFCHSNLSESPRFLGACHTSTGQNRPISPRQVGPQKTVTKPDNIHSFT